MNKTISKAYLFGVCFAFVLITSVFYLVYILNQKLDEVNKKTALLEENILLVKNLTTQFTELQKDHLKILHENSVLTSKLANESSTITLVSDGMSDEYKMLITLVFIILLLLSLGGVTYYSAFCLNSFVFKSFLGLKTFGLKFLNSLMYQDVLKELTYADRLNNLFRVVISGDGKTCEVTIQLSGQDTWLHLDTFLEQNATLVSRVMADNSLVLSGVGNLPIEASSSLVGDLTTNLISGLGSSTGDISSAALVACARDFSWLAELSSL